MRPNEQTKPSPAKQVSVILFARASKQFTIQTSNYQKENYVLNSGGSRPPDKERGAVSKKMFSARGALACDISGRRFSPSEK